MPYMNFRLHALLAAGLLLLAAPGLSAQEPLAAQDAVRGDVDGDGRVTRADAEAVRAYLVRGTLPAGGNILPAGDANGDGRVTAADAAVISRFAAGLDVSRFPVGRRMGDGAVSGGDALQSGDQLCTVNVQMGTVICREVLAGGTSVQNVIVGTPFVSFVATSAHSRGNPANEDTTVYTVAIKNETPQKLGTVDGTTVAPGGIRLFFISGPAVSSKVPGSGKTSIRLETPDDTATFTNQDGSVTYTDKMYFQYDEVVVPGDTTAPKTMRFIYTPNVLSFSYAYRVSAPAPREYGRIDIAQPTDSIIAPAGTTQLSATAYDAVGQVKSDALKWESSDSSVAIPNAAGIVTGVTGGTAVITATSSVPQRGADSVVIRVIQANPDVFVPQVVGNVAVNTDSMSSPFRATANDSLYGNTIVTAGWLANPNKTEKGGDVAIEADGSFTYDPPAGYEGSDSFQYIIKSDAAVDTATVSLTVAKMIWFVGNVPGACVVGGPLDANCGRLSSPYPTLTAFNDDNTGSGNNPAVKDAIFLFEGTYAGPVTLLDNQKLIGQDATASLATLALAGGTFPDASKVPPMKGGDATKVIINGADGINLAQNDSLYGFTLQTSGGGQAIGSLVSGFGTLTLASEPSADVIIASSGQALALTNGDLSGAFASVSSTGGANNVSLTSVTTTTGTVSLGTGALSGATNDALVIANGTGSFTYAGTITNTAARAVNVSGKTGGTVALSGAINPGVVGAAGGVSLTTNAGAAILLSGGMTVSTTTTVPFTATGGGTVEVTGTNTLAVTGSAPNAVNLNGITLGAGGINFASVSSTGITTGSAFLANSVTADSITVGSLTVAGTTGGTAHGVELTSNTATVTIGGGSVVNTAGDALFVSGGNAGVTVNASLAKTSAGRIANVASRTGGAVTVGNTISCTGSCTGILANANAGTIDFTSGTKTLTTAANAAVTLTNNTGTVSFTNGGLVINTTSGAGFTATGGGTVNVTTGATNNTITANAGGTAVNISGTTIGGSGVTFYSVNATGSGTNGIVLANTGAGAFEVTGDGASDATNTTRGRTTAKSGGGTVTLASGGNISGRSGHGVSLSSTGPVTLRNMVITGSGSSGDGINASTVARLTVDNTRITGHASDHGILGTAVSGLSLHHSEVDNNGTVAGVVEGPDIWNMRFVGLMGTDTVRNSNIHHSQENVFGIINTSGTLNLTVMNTNITDTGTGAGGSIAMFIAANGNSNITANFQNDSINRGRARGLQTSTETGSSATLNLTVNGSQFHNNDIGIENAHGSSGTSTFNITNNNLQTNVAASGQAINVNRLGSASFNGFGLFTGTISGNTIGTAGVANSGSDTGSGIEVESNGSGGITRVAIVNNTVREVGLHGIYVAAVDANIGGTAPPTLEARVASNTISNMEAGLALDAIHVLPGALNTDDLVMCVDIANNNATGVRNGLRVRPSGLPAAPSTVQLEGWDGVTAVNTYFTNRPNTLAGGTAAISTTAPPAPGGFFAVANCNTP